MYQPTALTSLRQHSTATAKQIGKLDRSDPNYLQQLKAILRPENSGRNEFHRKWQKNLLKTVSQPALGWTQCSISARDRC